jgi:peptide deformylase
MAKEVIDLAKDFVRVVKEFPEIVFVGDPVLRDKAEEVSVEEGKKIGERLGKVLTRYREEFGMGRGLAAPQIGIGKRVFVTFLDGSVQIYINPEVIERSETTNFYRELCLSSGIMSVDVERPQLITMKWLDENGEEYEQEFDGFLARLIQHEYDHLQGVVNLDIAVPGSIEMATFNPLEEKLRDKSLV